MKFKSKYKPNVVGKGKALPLGNNYYYMKGPKHSNGGIKIGKSDKTGIEVEGGEIMHVTPKETRVFSSVPFLQGSSPVEKVLGGENPNKVFKEQEDYKDRNNLNDDGTMKRKQYRPGGKNYTNKRWYKKLSDKDKAEVYKLASVGNAAKRDNKIESNSNNSTTNKPKFEIPKLASAPSFSIEEPSLSSYRYKFGEPKRDSIKEAINKQLNIDIKYNNIKDSDNKKNRVSKAKYIYDKASNYLFEHPNLVGDLARTGGDILGSVTSHQINKKMLEGLQYAERPASVMPAKLKTKININPQLEKMRESIAAYERAVDANTASSKVAQERKMNARLNKINITNQLYAQKEHQEAQLINRDKLNAQHVAMQNARDYNRWAEGKADFENEKADKIAENDVGLVQNLVGSVQDQINRMDFRRREDKDLRAIMAKSGNTVEYMKEHGFDSNWYNDKDKYIDRRSETGNYENVRPAEKRLKRLARRINRKKLINN